MGLNELYRTLAEIQHLQSELDHDIGEDLAGMNPRLKQHALDRFMATRQRINQEIRAKLDMLETLSFDNGFVFCIISKYFLDGRAIIKASFGEHRFPLMSLNVSDLPDFSTTCTLLKTRFSFALGSKILLIEETFVSNSNDGNDSIPIARKIDQHIYR